MASSSRRDNGIFKLKANSPRFFKVILQESITDGKLAIPKKYVRMYGNDLSNKVLLKVPTGAVWKAELFRHNGKIWLQNGWKEFVEYYSLLQGSFLVFEYEGNFVFRVLIFDMSALEIDYPFGLINADDEEPDLDGEFQEPRMVKTEDDVSVEIIDDISPRKSKEKLPLRRPRPQKKLRTNSSTEFRGNGCMSGQKQRLNEAIRTQPLTADEKANALHRVSTAFNSTNPFFMVAMQPSYVFHGARLTIPYNFAKTYFKKPPGHVILRVSDGRQWRVKYNFQVYNGSPNAKFLRPWRAFVLQNNLEVGDVCVFELARGSEILLDVVIYRATDLEAEFDQEPRSEETEDDVSVENIDDFFRCRKMKERSPSLCPRPYKKTRSNSTRKFDGAANVRNSVPSASDESHQFRGLHF